MLAVQLLIISNSAVVEDKSELASFPGPAQLFVAVGTEKWAGPGNEASPNRARRTVRGAFSLGEVTAAQVACHNCGSMKKRAKYRVKLVGADYSYYGIR